MCRWPGGTTGHAVGGALAAIIPGPEVASIAISIALIIRRYSLRRRHLAIGANCFNMAVVCLTWVIQSSVPYPAKRRPAPAAYSRGGVRRYIGLTLAAFLPPVEIWPPAVLFHSANGAAFVCPVSVIHLHSGDGYSTHGGRVHSSKAW